jgi:hypothetical protein
LGFVLLAIVVLWTVTEGWQPSFPYRWNSIPLTAQYARVDFEVVDLQRTTDARSRARQSVLALYELDNKPLEELRNKLHEHLFRLQQAKSFAELDLGLWTEFLNDSQRAESSTELEALFGKLQTQLQTDPGLEVTSRVVQNALAPYFETGLLDQVQHALEQYSISQIRVYVKLPTDSRVVNVDDVRLALVRERLRQRLQAEFGRESAVLGNADAVVMLIQQWFDRQQLPTTLRFSSEATKLAADAAESQVPQQMRKFRSGEPIFAWGTVNIDSNDTPSNYYLTESQLELLWAEHRAFVSSWSWPRTMNYVVARMGLFVAIFTLCGIYLWYDHPKWLIEWRHFLTLLLLFSGAVIAAYWLWRSPLRAELIPISLFAMVITILYRSELSLLLGAALCLVTTFSLEQGMGEFVTMSAVASLCSFLSGNVRSRTRLIFVGLWAAMAGIPTAVYVKVALGWTLSSPLIWDSLWIGLQVIFGEDL